MARKQIGKMLIEAGLIDAKQLEMALAEQARVGGRLGEIMAGLGFASEDAVSRALANQSGVDHFDLDDEEIEPDAVALIPEALARRLGVLPLRMEKKRLVLAMSNPTDIVAIDEIQRRTRCVTRVVSTSHRQLLRAIDRGYSGDNSGAATLTRLIERTLEEVDSEGETSARSGVVGLVSELFTMAIRRRASDIHFHPDKSVLRVRFRIDGELVQGPTLKRDLIPPVVARTKVLAGLDISETRIPQDGKIRFPYENGAIDLRVSTFPSVHGESVVIRVLDKDRQSIRLDSLGLDARGYRILENAARRPNGMMLAVGPTGSGKSTTLYAMLGAVSASKRKIITLEDPVEYEAPLVVQGQVNEKAGLTFAAGLRAILRHDPDVVLIGEMRDAETASLALRAALTGHLVFSTLHTNGSVATLARLLEMGLENYLVASCLSVVSAQRLIRLLCRHCASPHEPTSAELEAVGLDDGSAAGFARASGCDRCHQTGVSGQEALFEVLEVTPPIAQEISRGASIGEIEQVALGEGMVPFRALARQRAVEGRISLSELARISTDY